MVPNANARHYLLKAKQRDLIAAAGGIERAAAICSFSKSVVGRWNNPDSPEIMELAAIFLLEEETGRYDMSEAIAASRGRSFADEAVPAGDNACMMAAHAEVVVRFGELISRAAVAFSDGRLTPSELAGLDRDAAGAERALSELRKAAATGRGAGGLSVVGGAA